MIEEVVACSFTLSVFSLPAVAEEASQPESVPGVTISKSVPGATISKNSDASPQNPESKQATVYLAVDGMG